MDKALRQANDMRRNGGPAPKTAQQKRHLLRRLWRYLGRYKLLMVMALVMSVGGNLLALYGPMLSGYAVNAIGLGTGHVDFGTVFYYVGLMVAFYAASGVIGYLQSLAMIKLSRNVVFQMRKDVFNHLTEMPVSFFDRHQTGDIISTISYDIDTINASLSNDVVQILTSIVTVVGSLYYMIVISQQLVLVFAVTIPISIIITKHMSAKVRPRYRARSGKLGRMNGYVEEAVGAQKTVKAYHREDRMVERFDVKNDDAVEAYYQADYYGSIMGPAVNFVNNLSLALISVFGSLLYMAGGIQVGGITSFVQYSRKFSGPINEFANIMSDLQSAFAAAERVFNVLDEPAEAADPEGAVTLKNTQGDVRIEHLNFGYLPGREIIHDLNLTAHHGSVIAIVGETGAGKTTIINLLMRFYDADSGTISIDGLDIRGVTRESLRSAYTMVLQDTWLFHGTIRENIAYGRDDVPLEEVVRVAKAAKIHNYIASLPDGYETVLTDNAVNISKGQKQLMTIARAMLLDSSMLILDEATSNVDTRTERQIQDAMLQLMKNKTCFVIAHRLSTIQNADRILVVDSGNVVEQGTHAELMRRRGAYYELYRAQFDSGNSGNNEALNTTRRGNNAYSTETAY